jgi:hypothetical protein
MNWSQIVAFCLLTSLLPVLPVLGEDGLVVAPSVTDSRYCLAPAGVISLRLSVDFTYRNAGQTQIVLPRFSRLSGYALFRSEADLRADRPEARSAVPMPDMFGSLKIEPSQPSPVLFEAIPPGGSATRRDEVSIPLRTPGTDGQRLLGKSLLIQFTLDNWPGHRHIQESRGVWEPLGKLWARQDTTGPVNVTIESNPTPMRCFPRVD